MAKRKPMREPEEPGGMNMTPMIDVTFQLIIFFILVTDFSQAQIEKLTLPQAKSVIKTNFADATLMVVNILKDGTMKINGKMIYDARNMRAPEQERMAFTKLEEMFNTRRMNPKYIEPGPGQFAKYFMYVRADRSTDFEHVQRLLMMATRYGGVTKVMFGAMEEKGG